MPAWRAQPAGARSLATVLVVHEAFGVHEHIARCLPAIRPRRLARRSLPSSSSAQGDPRLHDDRWPRLFAERRLARCPTAQVLADLDALRVPAAGRQRRASAGRLGVTGFCWGGRIAWLYAAHSRR
jgi:carboxymethylenebutenolidase